MREGVGHDSSLGRPPCPSNLGRLPGGHDASGTVDRADLDLVLLHWGNAASPIPDGWTSQLPLGSIDQDELDAVLLNWGNSTAGAGIANAAVPEPSAVLILLISVFGLLATRRERR